MSTNSAVASPLASQTAVNEFIPPFQAGDRLTRDEFRRRYEAMPDVNNVELIEGVVYMSSPVSANYHGEPHALVLFWMGYYRAHTPKVHCGDNSTVWLDSDNAPQPDCYLRLDESAGGQSKVVDGYLHSAPELVVEVASSSVSYDLHDKLNAYRRNNVQEYVVWRVQDREVDWFCLHEGRYQQATRDDDGLFKSTTFPGLWLNPDALIKDDPAQVLASLQQGLDCAAHHDFVQRINETTQQ